MPGYVRIEFLEDHERYRRKGGIQAVFNRLRMEDGTCFELIGTNRHMLIYLGIVLDCFINSFLFILQNHELKGDCCFGC